jgi:nucleotide-binding universal stress UspA family protein
MLLSSRHIRVVGMVNESSKGLYTIWASDGTDEALAAAPVLRRWLVPASRQLDIVCVGPVGNSLSRRMVHRTAEQRAPDLREAEDAAQRSLAALGDTGLRTEVHLRWGTPSHEIALQAEGSHADVLVLGSGGHGPLHKAVLGSTAKQALFDTTRSVFLARDTDAETRNTVVVYCTNQRLFAAAVEMLHALHLAPETPVCLVALLEPVKPFGSMFVTLNEDIRTREQAAHDAQTNVLQNFLRDVATKLPESEHHSVTTVVRDCEPRDIVKAVEDLQPGLVIIGDSPHADFTSKERRSVAQLAEKLSCSVLVAR